MEQATIVGIDLAKRSFQLHGAGADGSVVFRRKLSRERLLDFLASQPRCVVAMEACAGAHQWGREIGELGHEVRLLPPVYVKPFVKRHKNDMADAEAICEAAQRPTMRFVAVKTKEQLGECCSTRATFWCASARRRSTRCGATWLSLALSRRRDRLMSIGWHRPSRVQVRGCQDRSVSWAPFCSIGSRTSMRRSTD